MNLKLTGVIVAGAVLIILVMGGALFANMYKKANSSDAEIMAMQKEISLQEIKKHSSDLDCWTYIGGQVFEADKVITANPEYASVLVTACGKDGTSIYTVQKYSKQELSQETIVKLREQLSLHQIGLLAP